MADFDDGQKAIIESIFNNALESKRESITNQLKLVASEYYEQKRSDATSDIESIVQKKIKEFEDARVPWYRFWSRKDTLGYMIAALIFIVVYFFDGDSDKILVHRAVHGALGTKLVLSEDLKSDDSTLIHEIGNHLQRNSHNKNKVINQHIDKSILKFMTGVDNDISPIKNAIKKVLDASPVLVFQQEGKLGQQDNIVVIDTSCTDDVRKKYTNGDQQQIDKEEHVLMQTEMADRCHNIGVTGVNVEITVPFYSEFYNSDGRKAHDVHLLVNVVRMPNDVDRIDNYKSKKKLENIRFELHHSHEDKPSPALYKAAGDGFDFTKYVASSGNNYYEANLSEVYKARYQNPGAYRLSANFLHAVSISTTLEYLEDVEESIAIRALIFINRPLPGSNGSKSG